MLSGLTVKSKWFFYCCSLTQIKNVRVYCRVPYLALARTFEIVENISGRLRTIEVLANFFRSVIILSPSDLIACVYLSLNQLAPAYEGIYTKHILLIKWI